ncbi:uncharacterized protein LOC133832425 [Humulus lupulus]|uniref:uncharacterized protein LOC133832425 n=1 Tax=Humulus lupulus TaxID=3486 RepID=UPI002B40FC23|nr:uncharacterized protein LOC133832425 [Humulus lupulus]
MKTRDHGSTSEPVKSHKETIPKMVPSDSPPVPASIPTTSPPTGCRPKTTARKKVLALLGPKGSHLIGATSKGVTFPNLDAQENQASAVPLTSPEGQVKSKPAFTTSPAHSVFTEAMSDLSEHDSKSPLSPDVLTPKAKGKRKSKAVRSKRTKKAKVALAKGTSSIYDSSPLSKFKLKEKINPPPCTSSEDVSLETEDSLPGLDPSLTEAIPEEPHEDLEEETESKEDTSQTTPVASDPKGTTPLAFPEFTTKHTKQKGARVRTLGSSFKGYSLTFCFNGNEKNMQFYEHHHFISERNFLFAPHRVFWVLFTLEERGLLRSLSGFDGFVPQVVKEFYANLNDELLHQTSFMFHKVYVRGHCPTEIAKALNLVLVEIDVSIEFAKDQVLSELVGQAMVWEPSASLHVSNLTHYYGALFKFAMFNWMPTTHSSTITQDMTFILLKIRTGVTVDLVAAIFYQFMSLSSATHKGQHLMFLQVIYKLLDSQRPLKKSHETLISPLVGPTYIVKEIKDDNASTTGS